MTRVNMSRRKALAITRQSLGETHDEVGVCYIDLADDYFEKGDYDQALVYDAKALANLQQSLGENHPYVALNYNRLGKIYAGKGSYAQAIAHYHKVLAITLPALGENHPRVAEAYRNLGEVYRQQQNLERALFYYQKTIISSVAGFEDSSVYCNPALNNLSSETHLLKALEAKADALKRLYLVKSHDRKDLHKALTTYHLSTELLDKIRTSYKAEGSKLFLARTAHQISGRGIPTALQLAELTREERYQHQAFLFAERSKAAILAEALQEANAMEFAGLPDSLLEKEKNLRMDQTFYETQIQKEREKRDGRDSLKIADFENRYFRRKNQYEQLVEALEKNYPQYYELKYQIRFTEIAALQKALAANSVLLEYFVGDSAIYIFVISPNDFSVKAVAKAQAFDLLVASLLRSIKKVEKAEFEKTSRALHKILVAPIQDQIAAAKKLIIIPDGALFYVPFEALISSQASVAVDFTAPEYLIHRYEISYHCSATLYQKAVSDQPVATAQKKAENFLGFAPVFSDSVRNGYIIASRNEADSLSAFADNLRAVMIDGKRFSELKYTAEEVAAIVKLFERKKKTGAGYFHRQASEENFKQAAGQYKFVHLATHGVLNEENPKLSGLIFSQPADSGNMEDGILYAGETFNLATNADLVVLSSCESGLGKLVKGEGLMALARGFIYSGAPNIIVSLWKVYDKHTSELMVELYKNILAGKSYAAALREAKLHMLRKPLTAFPQKWSAFVLVGGR